MTTPIRKSKSADVIMVTVCPHCDVVNEVKDPVDYVYFIDGVNPKYTVPATCISCHRDYNALIEYSCKVKEVEK